MWIFLGFAGATVFLAGLFQWAQGGATLWRIFRIRREEKENKLSREEILAAEREVQKLEKAADRTITASFKIIAVLAVVVWMLFGLTMLLDLFGINWISTLSSRAKSYWSQPNTSITSGTEKRANPTTNRNDMLKNMGAGIRK